MLVIIKFELQVFEVQKKRETNVWKSLFGSKVAELFFSKNVCSRSEGLFLSGYNQIVHKGELFKLIRVRIKKKLVSKVQTKWIINVWISIWLKKKLKLYFPQKVRACITGDECFFLGATKKVQINDLWASHSQSWKICLWSTKIKIKKLTFKISIWIKSDKKKVLKKCIAGQQELIFSRVQPKDAKIRVSSVGYIQKWKTTVLSTIKVKN